MLHLYQLLNMIAIIPCAGLGTRRRPDTVHTPKILLEHQGQPLIEHIVRPIDALGNCEKIVFVLGGKMKSELAGHGQKVIDYVRRHPFEAPVKFVWQPEPLGFGHAVLQARGEVFTPFIFPPCPLFPLAPPQAVGKASRAGAGGLRGVWNPPVLIHTDDAVNTHKNGERNLIQDITAQSVSQIGVQWRGNVRNYGMAITQGDGSFIERLVEKPYWDEGGLALTGIYYIRESRRLFRYLNRLVKTGRRLGGEYQFTHALQMMSRSR